MNRRLMGSVVPIALLMLIVVLLFVSSAAFAQSMPDRMELGFNDRAPRVDIAASIWDNDSSNIGLIRIPRGNARQVNPREIKPPAPNMYIYDVDVSPDASKIVIAGENIDDWTGGISVKDFVKRGEWTSITNTCSDWSTTWFDPDTIEYISCWIQPPQALRQSIDGGDPVPVLTDDYPQTAIAACPATGKNAIVEMEWVFIYTPEEEMHSRLVIVDADGNVITTMPWLVETGIYNLKWSDDGSQLMYYQEIYTPDTYFGALYLSDGTGYGVKLQDDAYLADFLPHGGYVYGQIDWINAGIKSHYQTTVTVVPGVGDPKSFTVNGAIDSLDVYLR